MIEEPIHPIIDRPHEYYIMSLNFVRSYDDQEAYLDLELQRGEVVRRLRFLSPHELEIEKGFPMPTGGMVIYDVRARQWENIGVRVDDFEASRGSIKFWAREVIDLDS